jgi:hypothetical protein
LKRSTTDEFNLDEEMGTSNRISRQIRTVIDEEVANRKASSNDVLLEVADYLLRAARLSTMLDCDLHSPILSKIKRSGSYDFRKGNHFYIPNHPYAQTSYIPLIKKRFTTTDFQLGLEPQCKSEQDIGEVTGPFILKKQIYLRSIKPTPKLSQQDQSAKKGVLAGWDSFNNEISINTLDQPCKMPKDNKNSKLKKH